MANITGGDSFLLVEYYENKPSLFFVVVSL